MNKNETALEMCLRMLKERATYWDEHIISGHQDIAKTYETAADLLKYAMQNDIECLRQFDYYHEDKEEE